MNDSAVLRHPVAVWAVLCLLAGVAAGGLAVDPGVLAVASDVVRWLVLFALFAYCVARPYHGVWLALASFPLNDYGRIVTAPAPITLFQVTLAGAILGWGWRLLAGDLPWRRLGFMRMALALPFAAALWSLPLSLDPGRSAIGTARLLALWLFALLVSYYAEDARTRTRMLHLFVGIGVALAFVSFAQYAFPDIGIGNTHVQFDAAGVEVLARPAAFYLDPNFLAGYLSVASLAAAAFVVHAKTWRSAAIWLAPALVCAAGVALTLSRSGLVGFVAGAVAVVLTAPPRRRSWLLAAMLALAIVAVPVLPDRYTKRIVSMGDVMSEGSLATRFLMVGSTLEIARDYWGTGTGLSAFEHAYPRYRRIGALPRILRPHEVPLAMPAEMGLPGLIAEIGLFAGLLWAALRARRRGWRTIDAAVIVGLVTLLVQSWFQYYLYFECLWLFAAFAASMADSSEGVPGV